MAFPTHVGMNRIKESARVDLASVPHTRGDEPANQIAKDTPELRSPHTWG